MAKTKNLKPQPDLFAAPIAPVPRPPPAPHTAAAQRQPERRALLTDIRPPRCDAWEEMLAEHDVTIETIDVQIVVSRLWTKVVIEELVHPAIGRRHLHADGKVVAYPGRDSATYLTVFMTADAARSLHIRTPLVQIGSAGTDCIRFRVAQQGEEAPTIHSFPEGM